MSGVMRTCGPALPAAPAPLGGPGGRRSQRPGARGVALLMVLGLLALVGSVIADFQFTSRVDLQLALNARDELQAEYNALSALRLRALILKQARKVQSAVDMLMKSIPGGMQAPPISQVLEMIPVECGLMSAITKAADSTLDAPLGDADGADSGHDFFPGECMAVSVSEHSKLAINLLRDNIEGRGPQVAQMLFAMLSDPRLHKHFEQDDRNGQHAESPLVLVNAITDYIDADHAQQGNLGDEDRYYQYLKDPYRAKNAPFDSVAELKLVYGIDDALFNLLRDEVSVYGSNPAMELATAPTERIVLFGLPAVLKDGTSPDLFIQAVPELLRRISLIRSLGGGMLPFTTQVLKSVLGDVGLSAALDPQKFDRTFTDRSSTTWYTIMAEGRMGNASRKIRAVFQASEGTFYYARVD